MSLIFLFVDGIGIGNPSEFNPFSVFDLKAFEILSKGKLTTESKPIFEANHVFKGIDANLDVEGLPQSGTGQASLFCGINAAKLVGHHFGPYPHSKTKEILKEHSFFSYLKKQNKTPHFINAYPKPFFEFAEKRDRWTCSSLMALGSGQKLHNEESIERGEAVTAEIRQDYWKARLQIPIPEIDEKIAAQRIKTKAEMVDLVFYEYYLTDKAGHAQELEGAFSALDRLDKLVFNLIDTLENNTLIITSDHGNLEDLSLKTHTRNEVPFIAYGKNALHFKNISSLIDVKESILSFPF